MITVPGGTLKPNVIIYVIDGGGADYMSAYGYPYRTTPALEALAAEGALFERAYSNASWTRPSVASLMTSLHSTVLAFRDLSDAVPQHALTMGERFHDLGYATAVFSSNPWAGFASGLSAGLDFLSSSSVANGFTASASLNDEFERWRAEFPGTPFWAHFQSTDVHTDTTSTAVRPFNDLFRWKASVHDRPRGPEAVRRTDVDQVRYDQAIAHTDSQIARLVRYLKRSGEWQNTLFIVTADHSIAASGAAGRAIIRARRIRETPMFAPFVSHIPLIIVWSGHIESGMRVTQPVSLIDLLPSIFHLTGLPPYGQTQGTSFGAVLQGHGFVPRPVILAQSDGKIGEIEIVDGRWGASMAIDSQNEDRTRLMLFDLRLDPNCLEPVQDRWPSIANGYRRKLMDILGHHRALAKALVAHRQNVLDDQQLDRLRSLGYVR